MTAAAASAPTELRSKGQVTRFRMKASEQIYAGALVMLNTAGTAEAAEDSSTGRGVVGVATEDKLSGASVAAYIEVQEAEVKLASTTLAQADVGNMHYVTDDLTADDVPGFDSVALGPLIEYIDASTGWYWASWKNLSSIVANKVRGLWRSFVLDLKDFADGDIITFTPGFVGEIMDIEVRSILVASTASKLTTLNLEIGTTDLTGGVVALTTANMDAVFDIVSGTAITAGSVFTAAEVITLEASSTTAFIEGRCQVNIELASFFGQG